MTAHGWHAISSRLWLDEVHVNMVFWVRLGGWIGRIIAPGEVLGGPERVPGGSPEAPGRVPEGSWEGPGRVPGWSWSDSEPRQAKGRDGA